MIWLAALGGLAAIIRLQQGHRVAPAGLGFSTIRMQPSREGETPRALATTTVPYPTRNAHPVQPVSRLAGNALARGVARHGFAQTNMDGVPWPMRGVEGSPNPYLNTYAYGANQSIVTTRIVES